ncbi:hypothetical protein ECDEC12D_2348 [Escherichia coli DEC12D]|nr:hypothetical protein ECDEC12D_2348 [Escherichia coli DEC12D]
MCIYLNLMILIKIIRGFIRAEYPAGAEKLKLDCNEGIFMFISNTLQIIYYNKINYIKFIYHELHVY